jgi:tripartite-type tricarboxylate transporter receptor subunit TctC
LVAGHVKLGTMTFSSAAEQVRAGKVQALAITSAKRVAGLPDVPTFREVGQDLVAATWFALSGPAKLPNYIVQQISRETLKAMQSPDVQKRLEMDAIETRPFSPEEFTKFIEAETALWAPLAKEIAATQKK